MHALIPSTSTLPAKCHPSRCSFHEPICGHTTFNSELQAAATSYPFVGVLRRVCFF